PLWRYGSAASTLWICATTAAPSPTAAAARLVEPARTSPMANTLGWLVSSDRTARRDALVPSVKSALVTTKPLSSTATQCSSHAAFGSAPSAAGRCDPALRRDGVH